MITKGIDTLEFGIEIAEDEYHSTFDETLDKLEKLKTLSQDKKTSQIITLHNCNFEVSPKGFGFYSYKLQNNEFFICFSKQFFKKSSPIFVKFFSEFLWEYDYLNAYKTFMNWFSNFNINILGTKISRLDICADIDTIDFKEKDIKNFFSRSSKSEIVLPDSKNYLHREFSGFVVGKGSPLLCRIYNKTKEIEVHNKLWFKEIWKQYNWNENETVWRVEFQIRRKILKEFNITSIEDIPEKLFNIWGYLTQKWLVLRIPAKDSNISRWKVNSKWKALQMLDFNYLPNPALRKKIRTGNAETLKNLARGSMLSLCAIVDCTMNELYLNIMQDLRTNCEKKHTSIDKEIEKRKHRFI